MIRRLQRFVSEVRTERCALIRRADWHGIDDSSFSRVKRYFATLPPDINGKGSRYRSYAALKPGHNSGTWEVDRSVITYSQPLSANPDDGGKLRNFGEVPSKIMSEPAVQAILNADVDLALRTTFSSLDNVILKKHYIRYASKGKPTWGSPVGWHADNETLVFVHLIDLHPDLIGGTNVIANDNFATPERVVELVAPLDTLVLAHQKVHAVTPMQARSPGGSAHRDVLLVTFQPREK